MLSPWHLDDNPVRRRMLLVDRTDTEREYAYRLSPMGRLEQALDESRQQGGRWWT